MRYLLFLIISIALVSCISIGSSSLSIYEIETPPEHQTRELDGLEFWDAMRQLDTGFARHYPDSSAERKFAQSLSEIMAGNYDRATDSLEDLVATSKDSLVLEYSGALLAGIYMLKSDWKALISLEDRLPGGIDDLNTIGLVKGWNSAPQEKVIYPADAIKTKMEMSLPGVPMIKVLVNGHEQTFWIDTGAAFTVLASDVAEECGVHPLVDSASKVGTSTDIKIELQPGVIDALDIQDLSFRNHPVFIIKKEDLEFRILKIFRLLKIDGILGWNAIQKLRLELDYAQESIVLSRPKSEQNPERNFHYIEQPFLMLQDTTGYPLSFFLDTGANKTSLYTPVYSVFDTTGAETSRAFTGGAGGSQTIEQITLRNQSTLLGNTRIDFAEINGSAEMGGSDEGFVKYDGVLGSDVPQSGVLILDFQNGWCELKSRD